MRDGTDDTSPGVGAEVEVGAGHAGHTPQGHEAQRASDVTPSASSRSRSGEEGEQGGASSAGGGSGAGSSLPEAKRHKGERASAPPEQPAAADSEQRKRQHELDDDAGEGKRPRDARADAVATLPHWLCGRFGADWATRFHASHTLMVAAPLVYCAQCGRWSTGHAVLKLAAPCPGPLGKGKKDHGYKSRLRAMDAGLDPLSGLPLGSTPVPLHRGQL